MKNPLFKDFIREIKGNMGRFMSIFFIVLLGSAFFSGIRSTSRDMKYSADYYYDRAEMMDIRVLSTMGLTDEDLQDIENIEEVKAAYGGYTKEVMNSNGKDEFPVKLIAYTKGINEFTVKEGRLPEKDNECVVDEGFFRNMEYNLGDRITFTSGTEDELSEDLKVTEYIIVGTGYLPYYMDLTRGSCSIGDGQLKGFVCVRPEVFDMDIYTEIYVKIAGAKELNTYSDEYDELSDRVINKIEAISHKGEDRRYEDVISKARKEIDEKKQQIEEAETKLSDAKSELDNGKKELDDADQELKDGWNQLEEGKIELDSARIELDDSKNELENAKSEINRGEEELRAAKAQVDMGETELIRTKAELDSGKAELDTAAAQIESGKQQIAENETLLEQRETELLEGRSSYESGIQQLEEQKQALEEAGSQLQTVERQLHHVNILMILAPWNNELLSRKQQLEEGKAALEQGISQGETQIAQAEIVLEETRGQLENGEVQIAQGRAEIEAAKAQIAGAEEEYYAGLAGYNEGYQKYLEGVAKWEAGKREYEEGLAGWEAGRKEYEDGLLKWDEGNSEYEDGLKKYEENQAKLEEARKEYEDGLRKWNQGDEEYLEKSADSEKEIADAKEKISDAEDQLSKLERPEWYILGRDKISSAVSYGMDADRMDSLGNVFPVIFFLVAALVSLTAMTRMVEEQRMQIGTLKALGYRSSRIAEKYIGYALLATTLGAVIGVIIGEKSLPAVIISSYKMLYTGLPEYFTMLNWVQGGLAIAFSIICTCGATFAACYKNLRNKPAELMRPEAPKIGKRILAERITFLWKRLNFTQKATLRNLFRYKKRFIMTIIGIGGCMGLLLVGYGLRDSIEVVAKNQFKEIIRQNAGLTVDAGADDKSVEKLEDLIRNYEGIENYLKVCQLTVTLNEKDTDRGAILCVPKDIDNISDFVRMRDRKTKEAVPFPKDGAVISEKTADMLDVKIGDTIGIRQSEKDKPADIQVAGIMENYVQHYIYISPKTYESLFKEPVKYNHIYLNYDSLDRENEKELGSILLKEEACTGVSFTSDLQDQIDNMLKTLDLVIWVLIIAAALLAFVVLYNLNSINITERRRELATLKVLGFYDMEVAMYIYRENILLTLIGLVVGTVIGTILHLFTVVTVEVDLMMFGRHIELKSYIICMILTLLFSMIVNIVMFSYFKKIDMIESLKSVE